MCWEERREPGDGECESLVEEPRAAGNLTLVLFVSAAGEPVSIARQDWQCW